jgi:hypothetical protein
MDGRDIDRLLAVMAILIALGLTSTLILVLVLGYLLGASRFGR